MRTLLVYTHPVAESFTAAVRDAALAGLRAASHDVRVIDLYTDDFDPRLSRQGRLDYLDTAINTRSVEAYVAQIRWAEALVFVFPTWNQGVPAMLKGWFDRVWLPEVSFHLQPGQMPQAAPLLTNVRLMIGITTAGAPRLLTWLAGHTARRMLLRGMRSQCHPKCRTLWLAHYRIDSSTPQSRAHFLDRVRKRMAAV